MNQALARLIRNYGREIWPFLEILARFTLEAKSRDNSITVESGEYDESFLESAAISGILRYSRSGSKICITLIENDGFLYASPIRSSTKPQAVERGSRARFVGIGLRNVMEALGTADEEVPRHLFIQLSKLQRRHPDELILKLAERAKGKLAINQFLTNANFERLLREYNEEQSSFSHRGTQEYSEWQ